MPKGPKVGYVIRCYNSEQTVGRILSILTAFVDPAEIICVDSGSIDQTQATIRRFGCTLIELEGKFSFGGALNAGFKRSNADWIVSLSSHCIPIQSSYPKDWVDLLRDIPTRISMVAGAVVSAKTKIKLSDEILVARSTRSALFPGYYVGNPNCAYRRVKWEARPFDEGLAANEDAKWCIAALRSGEWAAVGFSVPVLYRRDGSLVNFYNKGFLETSKGDQSRNTLQPELVKLNVPLIVRLRVVLYRIGQLLGKYFIHD